jgi:hypothetical protein
VSFFLAMVSIAGEMPLKCLERESVDVMKRILFGNISTLANSFRLKRTFARRRVITEALNSFVVVDNQQVSAMRRPFFLKQVSCMCTDGSLETAAVVPLHK